MKKLLIVLALATTFTVSAQPFQSLKLLSVQSLSVSNTAGFTNTMPYFGWSGATSNTSGVQYTNTLGTWIIDQTGATAGFVSVSNGFGYYTNDTTFLTKDIPFHADRNGNVCTNYNLNCAAIYNGTSTGNVVAVFAPIVAGGSSLNPSPAPFQSSPLPTLLDLKNTVTVNFPVILSGATNTTVAVNWSSFNGYRGMRLMSIGMTNALGQAWIEDLSVNTFVP